MLLSIPDIKPKHSFSPAEVSRQDQYWQTRFAPTFRQTASGSTRTVLNACSSDTESQLITPDGGVTDVGSATGLSEILRSRATDRKSGSAQWPLRASRFDWFQAENRRGLGAGRSTRVGGPPELRPGPPYWKRLSPGRFHFPGVGRVPPLFRLRAAVQNDDFTNPSTYGQKAVSC